jgi:Zn-dependent protease with chaperone function
VTWYLFLPVGLVLLAVAGAGALQRRLRPQVAARLLASIAVLAAVAAVSATFAVTFGYLVEVSGVAELLGWCSPVLSDHDRISTPSGVAAAIALGLMLSTGSRRQLRRRRTLRRPRPAGPVDIVPSAEPIAYAVPGRPGHVVVSVGMLRALHPDERTVLFAHEQAHLDHRHDRYVAAADLAAALVPLLRPLAAQVRHATERWADEVAAEQVGDRGLVARAIARAALAGRDTRPPAFALTGLGVRARVDALLEDPERLRPYRFAAAVGGTAAFILGVTASALQLHHVLAYVLHICAT